MLSSNGPLRPRSVKVTVGVSSTASATLLSSALTAVSGSRSIVAVLPPLSPPLLRSVANNGHGWALEKLDMKKPRTHGAAARNVDSCLERHRRGSHPGPSRSVWCRRDPDLRWQSALRHEATLYTSVTRPLA